MCGIFYILFYGKCSKILNTSCMLKQPRQTGQTQIRLLLKKQSDQGLPCLLLGHPFCDFLSLKPTFYLRTERESVQSFRTFTVYFIFREFFEGFLLMLIFL